MTIKIDDLHEFQGMMTLVIPCGKEPVIFPWGVHLIADYLEEQIPKIKVNILDLSLDSDIQAIFESYQKVLNHLKVDLIRSARNVFEGNSSYNNAYFGMAAALGERFIDIAIAKHMFSLCSSVLHSSQKTRRALTELSIKFDKVIETKLRSMCLPNSNVPHFWGISTFDHTAFNTLHLASCIRQYTNPNAIIFGGDYWDFNNAWKMMNSSQKLVDGVVVGYGEHVIKEMVCQLLENATMSVDELSIKGLVNRSTIKNENRRENIFASKQEALMIEKNNFYSTQQFSVPKEYFIPGPLPFKLVHVISDNTRISILRLLTQRGCSWGRCQFCTQLDKQLFFEFPFEIIRQELMICIENIPSDKKIKIMVDNDEISPSILVSLIEFLSDYSNRIETICMWLQVKSLNNDILKALCRAGNASQYFFALNWESMNPKTLKLMGKGHTPLDNIVASKSILDVGAQYKSNYMFWYPSETRENKEAEFRFLSSVSHLAYGRLNVSSYGANRRDNIFNHAKSMRIKIRRNPYDVWIREVYHCDLEYSFWLYSWNTCFSKGLFSKISRLFEWAIAKYGTKCFFPAYILTGIVAFFSGNFVLMRIAIFLLMMSSENAVSDQLEMFYSENERLIRKSRKFRARSFDIKLSDTEVAVLHETYRPITEEKLFEAISSRANISVIKDALFRLESLAAIVRYDNLLVSVVNDKKYWTATD